MQILTLVALEMLALSVGRARPLLVWNSTPSAPEGLYVVGSAAGLRAGDRVLYRPADDLAEWLEGRSYLPRDGLLIKVVGAVPGQIVCRRGDSFAVDQRIVVAVRRRDRAGRWMPVWRGCRAVRTGELLLLGEGADSLDSRYFGPLPADGVLGRLTLVHASRP